MRWRQAQVSVSQLPPSLPHTHSLTHSLTLSHTQKGEHAGESPRFFPDRNTKSIVQRENLRAQEKDATCDGDLKVKGKGLMKSDLDEVEAFIQRKMKQKGERS